MEDLGHCKSFPFSQLWLMTEYDQRMPNHLCRPGIIADRLGTRQHRPVRCGRIRRLLVECIATRRRTGFRH
jgi:hypothetical protein